MVRPSRASDDANAGPVPDQLEKLKEDNEFISWNIVKCRILYKIDLFHLLLFVFSEKVLVIQ